MTSQLLTQRNAACLPSDQGNYIKTFDYMLDLFLVEFSQNAGHIDSYE